MNLTLGKYSSWVLTRSDSFRQRTLKKLELIWSDALEWANNFDTIWKISYFTKVAQRKETNSSFQNLGALYPAFRPGDQRAGRPVSGCNFVASLLCDLRQMTSSLWALVPSSAKLDEWLLNCVLGSQRFRDDVWGRKGVAECVGSWNSPTASPPEWNAFIPCVDQAGAF